MGLQGSFLSRKTLSHGGRARHPKSRGPGTWGVPRKVGHAPEGVRPVHPGRTGSRAAEGTRPPGPFGRAPGAVREPDRGRLKGPGTRGHLAGHPGCHSQHHVKGPGTRAATTSAKQRGWAPGVARGIPEPAAGHPGPWMAGHPECPGPPRPPSSYFLLPSSPSQLLGSPS
nr:cuticle collagen 2C-like [Aegilops tauschii subsp. strangulata]